MTNKRLARPTPGVELHPQSPDLELMKHLHRARECYIHLQAFPFGRHHEGGDAPIPVRVRTGGRTYTGSVPVRLLHEWQGLLPQVRDALLHQLAIDGYAGVHSAYSPKPFPATDDFRRLNAAMVDCDCYDLDYDQAFALVAKLVADRALPPWSMVTNTGHGLHIFWLLCGDDEHPALPPRSFARNRTLLVDINRALIDRTGSGAPELRPDRQPTGVTTHTRVPGSMNTRANSRVAMTLNLTVDGIPPTYTLAELREFLELPERIALSRPRADRDGDHRPDPRKQKGHRARWQGLLHELELLGRHRNGFAKGTRRKAVYFMATFMTRLGHDEQAIMRAAVDLARECRPHLAESDARSQARSGMKRNRKYPQNASIADALRVTPDEVALLNLAKIRPDFAASAPSGDHRQRRALALHLLRQLIEQHGPRLPMTFVQLHDHLHQNNVTAARGSVQNWLREAGGSVVQSRGPYKQPSKQQPLELTEAGDAEPTN